MYSIRCVLIFFTLLAISIQGFSQTEEDKKAARDYMDIADEMLAGSLALTDALGVVELAAKADTTFLRASYMAGDLRLKTVGKEQAAQYLLRVLRQDPDYNFGIEYWIGKSYQYGLEFDKALEYFNRYKNKLTKKANYQGKDRVPMADVDRSIQECNTGKTYVSNPGEFSIVNIGAEINSPFDDFGPVLSETQDEIVFTSRRPDDNQNQNVADDNFHFEDIYTAKKSGDKWAYAVNLGPKINGMYHDSNLAMSADGGTLFIYNDDNGGDIYYCERQADRTWGPLSPLPGIINSSFQEKSISITKDERTLYFTSNRPGGLGGTDIYRATKNTKGEWSNVKNLGPRINTPLNDDGPFIDYDGITLYFSSQGHNGMGGYDIYKSKHDAKSDDWSEPENLGYPINTPDNDIYFITSADSKRAYYSSVRGDGQGFADIYVITAGKPIKDSQPVAVKDPEPVKADPPKKDTVVTVVKNDPPKQDPPKQDPPKQDPPKKDPPKKDPPVKQPEPKKELKPLIYIVKVVDSDAKNPLSAKINLRGQRDNIIVASTSNTPGTYEFKITNPSAKDYTLSVEIDGYVFTNQNVRIGGASEKDNTVNRTIEMRRISVGVTSILRNIYFEYDKARFKTESYAELNKLEAMLRQNTNMQVEIGGHTDAYGKWDYNKQLSQKRAEAVKDYLTKKGIDSRRIKAMGYGETKPLASNDDEDDGRELNRRVEFKVLQK
jgi:outer membrane protein OmpA-like peptidoglycan-associated protein